MRPFRLLLIVCLVLGPVGLLAVTRPDAGEVRSDGADRRHHAPADDLYRSPIGLAVTSDGRQLLVVCESIGAVLIVDTATQQVTGEIPVGRRPFAIALSPDERFAYVTNRWDDTVSVIDLASRQVVRSLPTGGDPHGLACSRDGKVLYVANLNGNDISVLCLQRFQEIRRLRGGVQPFEVTLSPDGRFVYVSSQLTDPVPFRTPAQTEVTIIDSERQIVTDRRSLALTNLAQGIAASPDGELVLVALEIPKNLIPETQIYQGWMVTYGVAVLEAAPGGRSALLLIDEMNQYYADPFGIAFTPDGRYAYVSSSGVDAVSVIDMARVRELLQLAGGRIGVSDEQLERFGRHLALSSEYVVGRIPTGGYNPKDIVVSPDGTTVYVANRLSDTISVIAADTMQLTASIDLGGPREITLLRRGEYLFNHAEISFQRQMACNTCHPESNVDGLLYDIAVDGGLGGNLVDNRSMRGVAFTGPFKWTGKNPSLARQEGPRAAQIFFRSHGFTGTDRDAVVAFIESTPLPPNRHANRAMSSSLTPAQERGKALFERDVTRDGRYIPIGNRCITCHPAPYYTDKAMHDVGTRAYFDTDGSFDTPQLGNVVDTPPYLHDGRAWTLEEIWTVYNPYDLHGVANDMTKQQLNDLIEYLKTL